MDNLVDTTETSKPVRGTLILFSCWLPDVSENSSAWVEFYRSLLTDELGDFDKVIGFNLGCPDVWKQAILEVPNVIAHTTVLESFHINSDAAGFQAGLKLSSPILGNYKTVLFLQSKGTTKGFADFEGFRWYFGVKLLNAATLTHLEGGPENNVAGVFAHPPTSGRDIAILKRVVAEIDPSLRPFMLSLTYTVYACAAPLLVKLLAALGERFFSENIGQRFDRFFFETMFPSLLMSMGGTLSILSDGGLNPALHPCLSYNYDLPHSTAVVSRLIGEFHEQADFEPHPVPMVFGPVDLVKTYEMIFST